MKPDFLLIHHSLTSDGQTVSWQAIRDYHVKTRGWLDVGYQYGIEQVNARYEILKGRMDDEDGAHAKGFNDKSIGICLIGNFDHEPPPKAQMLLLLKLAKSLMALHGIPVSSVLGHRETFSRLGKPVEKTCPGSAFDMAGLRAELA